MQGQLSRAKPGEGAESLRFCEAPRRRPCCLGQGALRPGARPSVDTVIHWRTRGTQRNLGFFTTDIYLLRRTHKAAGGAKRRPRSHGCPESGSPGVADEVLDCAGEAGSAGGKGHPWSGQPAGTEREQRRSCGKDQQGPRWLLRACAGALPGPLLGPGLSSRPTPFTLLLALATA